mgnify:CR=1 FL=1
MEKNVIKISFSTFFLILAVIAIVIMGVFMYKISKDKSAEQQKSNELQSQVNNLQEKIDQISNTINSNNTSISKDNNVNNSNTIETSKNNTNNTNNKLLSEEQVKNAIAQYLELQANANCGTPLNLLKEKGKIDYDPSKDTINTSNGVISTNVKFTNYKNAMLNYVTESEFEKNWTSKIGLGENSNGYLTHFQGGGGLRVYTIKSISKIDDTTFYAKTSSVVEDNEFYEENNYTVKVKSVDGKCVIDSFE